MWKLFGGKPSCPVEPEMRQWIDDRFQWLGSELGKDIPRRARVVLPTPEFFPDIYEGRPDDAQAMLVRVAGYMGADPNRFKLFIYNEHRPRIGLGSWNHSGSSGLYVSDGDLDSSGRRRAAIGIEESGLPDPMRLVATLAHEIGHEILLGGGRVSRDTEDHEPLTDLLTVFKGMGIFGANATIRDGGWSAGGMQGWSTARLGYLNQRMFGYALARFAWTRDESRPTWMKHIRLDVRTALRQGLRYLTASERGG